MLTVNMLDAKTRLSRLVEAVESGAESEIIIARNGKPAAKLVPVGAKQAGRFGIAKESTLPSPGKTSTPPTTKSPSSSRATTFLKLLLDTHVAVWAFAYSDKLTDDMRELLTDTDNEIVVSVVTIWEIAVKRALGKRGGALPFSAAEVVGHVRASGYAILDVTAIHAIALSRFLSCMATRSIGCSSRRRSRNPSGSSPMTLKSLPIATLQSCFEGKRHSLKFPHTIRSRGPPKSRPARPEIGKALHGFDPHDVFGHLVAELPLDPQAQRRAMRDRQRLVVHVVGEDRLRMEGVLQVDALVIAAGAVERLLERIGAGEDDVARVRLRARRRAAPQRHALPLADAAPTLDAIVPGDLGARRHRPQFGEREGERPLDQAVDRKPPVVEPSPPSPDRPARRHCAAVGTEVRREVGFGVLLAPGRRSRGAGAARASQRLGARRTPEPGSAESGRSRRAAARRRRAPRREETAAAVRSSLMGFLRDRPRYP